MRPDRRALAAVALLSVALALPAQAAVQAVPAKRTDQMKVKQQGALIEIRSPSGVGSGVLKRGGAAWPRAMKFEVRGLDQLEHCRVTAGDMSLVCGLERKEGVAAERVCRVGDRAVQPPVERGSVFEVVVPPELLATHEDSMVVEWVNSWR